MKIGDAFPSASDKIRLDDYNTYSNLLEGDHISAFNIRTDSSFSPQYNKLRYVTANFAGLVAKMCGDMLFGEPLQLKAKNNQDWLNDFWDRNDMDQKCYELAVNNSAQGDALFKIKVKNREIMVEAVNPSLYFPVLDGTSFEQHPEEQRLCWIETYKDSKSEDINYCVCEVYTFGFVNMEVYIVENSKLKEVVAIDRFNQISGKNYVESVKTGLNDRNLLVFLPNFRVNYKYFGQSDFKDLTSLVFAVNNRLTKTDNILDKHSDPILAVPPGILDEKGQINKRSLNLIEMEEDGSGKPEYIVWNANLDAAMTEIDKLVKMLFFMSETAPDAFGISEGSAPASGIALKMRLIRTIAKMARKKLYFTNALSELFETVQLLSKVNGYVVNGKSISSVDTVELYWSDGLVNDDTAMITDETAKIDAGLQSKKRAIMVLENVDEAEADLILEEISEEEKEDQPFFGYKSINLPSRNGAGVQAPVTSQTINLPLQSKPVQNSTNVPINPANR